MFGWDRVWGADGAPVHDRLFVMTSMPPEIFPIDPRALDNLLAKLWRQLGDACLPHTELTPYPGAGTVLRALSKSPAFMEMDCFYLSVLYTFLLGILEDINDPDTAAWHARSDVWQRFRAGYMCYEERLLRLLEAHSARGEPVLLGGAGTRRFSTCATHASSSCRRRHRRALPLPSSRTTTRARPARARPRAMRRRLTPPRTTATCGATAGCLWRARRSAPSARRALLLSRDTFRSHALCFHEIIFVGPDRSRGSRS